MVDGSGRNIDLVQPLQFFRLQGDSSRLEVNRSTSETSFPEISARALEISRPSLDRFWTTPYGNPLDCLLYLCLAQPGKLLCLRVRVFFLFLRLRPRLY